MGSDALKERWRWESDGKRAHKAETDGDFEWKVIDLEFNLVRVSQWWWGYCAGTARETSSDCRAHTVFSTKNPHPEAFKFAGRSSKFVESPL